MAAAGPCGIRCWRPQGGALGPRDSTGAAPAGARGADAPEPRAREERAQPRGKPPPAPTFPFAGEESSGERVGAAAAGALGSQLPAVGARTPTPSKLGCGGGGPRRRRGREAGRVEPGATTWTGARVSGFPSAARRPEERGRKWRRLQLRALLSPRLGCRLRAGCERQGPFSCSPPLALFPFCPLHQESGVPLQPGLLPASLGEGSRDASSFPLVSVNWHLDLMQCTGHVSWPRGERSQKGLYVR